MTPKERTPLGENIVGRFSIEENERRVYIDDAWNFRKVIEIDDKGNITRTFANASEAARAIGILPGSMRNTIRRNGRCKNGFKYQYVENEK